MKEQDLKKLKRQDLLEIMLAQSREIDKLQKELEKEKQRNVREELIVKNAGSIAEASVKLTAVFEEAQKAADLYLESIRRKAGMNRKAASEPFDKDTESAAEEQIQASVPDIEHEKNKDYDESK